MAPLRKLAIVLLMLSLLLCAFSAQGFLQGRDLLQTAQAGTDCPEKCDTRCSKAGRADRCVKYCLICCSKCNCVPAGTYGYPPGDCECYANIMTKKGTHKCP